MMPYTPPSSRSPAASATNSPNTSRRGSWTNQASHPPSSSPRPDLPRSSSYLTRQHRRTPVAKASPLSPAEEQTPPGTADSENSTTSHMNINGSIRKSPPPVTDDSRAVPNAAVLSPPESTNNSSDDEAEDKGRGRQDRNLEELKAAIRLIEQNRSSSPNKQAQDLAKANKALSLVMPASDNDEPPSPELRHMQRHLSVSARKLMHTRANTDSSVFIGLKTESNSEEEDSEEDERFAGGRKPPMLRKKSGELVRPALRPSSSKRRPSSMPGTPTFSKAVHFDNNLEHVRHFLQVDRPLAVSAGSSPVDTYDDEIEFPFEEEDSKQTSFEWEIVVASFADNSHRQWQPIRLERVFLSADNKNLIGTVAVANLGFQKTIVARFTLDYWKTTSEVVAEYVNDVRRKQEDDGFDRFSFSVKLADQANLEAKTMFFCVKFCVNGQEHWDNNNGTNYQVDFRKKTKPVATRKGRSNGNLPRSNKRASQRSRPVIPVAFDDFSQTFESKFDFDQSLSDIDTANPTIRLKGVKSAFAISNSVGRKKQTPINNAFSTRYDFGTSLASAINAANTLLGDKSGLPQPPKDKRPNAPAPGMTNRAVPAVKNAPVSHTTQATNGSDSPRPLGSEKPVLASQSYSELLDKYCFFGSAKGSPVLKDGTESSRHGQLDGNDDVFASRSHSPSPVNAGSPLPSPYQESPLRMDSIRGRSQSPAPMTGFVTGTSTMYPYAAYNGFPFNEAHSATAIRG